jgi:hypothetical protein
MPWHVPAPARSRRACCWLCLLLCCLPGCQPAVPLVCRLRLDGAALLLSKFLEHPPASEWSSYCIACSTCNRSSPLPPYPTPYNTHPRTSPPQVNFVNPDSLGSLATFERVLAAPINRSRDRNASAEERELGATRSA